MARLKHPEQGTEIEVDDATAKELRRSGWATADGEGKSQDDGPRRRKPARTAD